MASVNARYTHTSLACRYLYANLGELQACCDVCEFTINDAPEEIVGEIVKRRPAVIGLGVYIWNRQCMDQLVPQLREALPHARIVLGGPEITHDSESTLAKQADCVICGEGDLAFSEVCRNLLDGNCLPHRVSPPPTDLAAIALPYDSYSAHDLKHRAVYFESSRGCSHGCEFCLSALDSSVRKLPENQSHAALDKLLERGVQNLRVVDRSFNLGGATACRFLDHVLSRPLPPWFCLHLELTPDEMGPTIRSCLAAFPPNSLHVEVGIQTLNPEVSGRVQRPMDVSRVKEGLCFLLHETQAAVHADLIAGLPGETPESFIAGFDQLYAWGPHEIQVGILKKLHGAPIVRHQETWGLRFRHAPPYDILETSTMPGAFIESVQRFASHWERVVNRNHLPRTLARLCGDAVSPWETFNRFSLMLAERRGLHGIGLHALCADLLEFMPSQCGMSHNEVVDLLREDYIAEGKRVTVPGFLREGAHAG